MLRLRLILLRLIRQLLRLRARQLTIPTGPILIIAPHPDDETLGCGGLIQLCRRSGQRVHCLFLTDGEASHPNHPLLTSEKLARLRTTEAREATRHLGLNEEDLAFLHLPDGQLPHLGKTARENAINAVSAVLKRIRPVAVFTTYHRDGSSEHEASFLLLKAALEPMRPPPRLFEYLVWAAYSPHLLTRTFLEARSVSSVRFSSLGAIKHTALAAYRSQFVPTAPWTTAVQPNGFGAAFSTEEEFFIESNL